MKLFASTAALLTLIAAPALAQTTPAPAPAPAVPATAPAASAATATPAVVSRLNLDTPIETIAADPQGKAILTADLGADVTQHPAYESFKGMSLAQVAPMSGGKITDDMLKKVATDLAAIK